MLRNQFVCVFLMHITWGRPFSSSVALGGFEGKESPFYKGIPKSFTQIPKRQSRVSHGEFTHITKVPFMLSLEREYPSMDTDDPNNHYLHQCGASIISSSWALTAAHCLEDVATPTFGNVNEAIDIIRSGSTFKQIGGTVHKISKIFIHKDYNSETMVYDVGLIKGYEGKDSTQGDSGGPLFLKDAVVGIVSHADEARSGLVPGAYIDVAHIRKWIIDTTANN